MSIISQGKRGAVMTTHFSRRERNVFIVCLGVIGVYVLNNFVYTPIKERSEWLDKQIQNSQKEWLSASRTIHKSKAVQQKYRQWLDSYRQKQSDGEVMSSVLTEIESTAASNNLNIADLKPNKPKGLNHYKEFSVSLVLEGDFIKVMEFIFILQKSPYDYFVDEADISRKSQRTNELRCRFRLTKVLIP